MLNSYYIKSVCEQDISQINLFPGETSSGKSTLINKILGIKLFKGKLAESTSTICKIRNSDQIKIVTTNKTGEINEKYFLNIRNLSNKADVRVLRNYLKMRTDLTHMPPDFKNADFQTVDILLPVPFLKVNHACINTEHMQVCIFSLRRIIPIIQIVVISYVLYDVCCRKQVKLG